MPQAFDRSIFSDTTCSELKEWLAVFQNKRDNSTHLLLSLSVFLIFHLEKILSIIYDSVGDGRPDGFLNLGINRVINFISQLSDKITRSREI